MEFTHVSFEDPLVLSIQLYYDLNGDFFKPCTMTTIP